MQFRDSRQMVTGLVVNEKVNIRSDYYRRARAMCDSLFQTGKYYKSVISSDEDGVEPSPDWISNLNPLHGILGHIYSVTQVEERRDVRGRSSHAQFVSSFDGSSFTNTVLR